MLIGYARVSTEEQDTRLQLDALKKAGVKKIYQEKASGAKVDRPELLACLSRLKSGDVLVVWKIDRVARSLADLLRILGQIQARGATIKSLTEPLDTTTPVGMFTIQILGAVAELERAIIRERCMAGREAARSRGVRFGRPALATPDLAAKVGALRRKGWLHTAISEKLGVSLATETRAYRMYLETLNRSV